MKEKPLTEFLKSEKIIKEKVKKEEVKRAPKLKEVEGPWELPEGWRWVRLGDVVEIKYGKGLPKTKRKSGNVPVFGSNGIVGYHNESLTKGPTIIIGRKGSVGAVNFSPVPCWPIDTTYYIDELKISEIDMNYLYWLLLSLNLPELVRTAVIPGINRNDLYKLKIPLPPFPEQKRIVAKLDEIHAKLEEAKRLACEAKEQAEKLMASALHEVFSKVNERGWEWVRLGDVADYVNGYHFGPKDWKETGLPIVRIQNLNDPNAPYNYFDGELNPKYKIKTGDILVAWSASLGVYKWDRGDAWLNQHIFKVVFKRSDILPDYYYYAVKSIIEEMKAETHGSVMKHITKPKFLSLKIPLPPLDKQKLIVAYLDRINKRAQKIVKLYEEREKKLEQLFPAILNKAFRGELV